MLLHYFSLVEFKVIFEFICLNLSEKKKTKQNKILFLFCLCQPSY
jgi:hypothetical protein